MNSNLYDNKGLCLMRLPFFERMTIGLYRSINSIKNTYDLFLKKEHIL